MGRHAVVFAAGVSAIALLGSACGITPADDEPLAGSDEGDACPSVDVLAPSELPEGVLIEYDIGASDHVLCEVAYESSPPAGGEHFPVWQNCGFYDQPLRHETAVHSLEHGAVWVAYADDLDTSDLAAIEASVAAESHLLASPYPDLANPIVLSAWKRQLAVSSWADPLVADFLEAQLGGRSTTAPEAGASCGSAIGTPGGDPHSRYDEALAQFIDG